MAMHQSFSATQSSQILKTMLLIFVVTSSQSSAQKCDEGTTQSGRYANCSGDIVCPTWYTCREREREIARINSTCLPLVLMGNWNSITQWMPLHTCWQWLLLSPMDTLSFLVFYRFVAHGIFCWYPGSLDIKFQTLCYMYVRTCMYSVQSITACILVYMTKHVHGYVSLLERS